jgi:hypothetical protein
MKKRLTAGMFFLLFFTLAVLIAFIWGRTAIDTFVLVVGVTILARASSIGPWFADVAYEQKLMFARFFGKEEKDLSSFWGSNNPRLHIWAFRIIGTVMSVIAIYSLNRTLFS